MCNCWDDTHVERLTENQFGFFATRFKITNFSGKYSFFFFFFSEVNHCQHSTFTLIFSWKKPPSIDLPKVCSTMVSSITSSWACWRYAWSSIDNHYMRLVMCLSVSSTHKLNSLHSSNYRQHYLFATQLFSICLFQDNFFFPHSRNFCPSTDKLDV